MLAKRKRKNKPSTGDLALSVISGNSLIEKLKDDHGFQTVDDFENDNKIDNGLMVEAIDSNFMLITNCTYAGCFRSGGQWQDSSALNHAKINPILLRAAQ